MNKKIIALLVVVALAATGTIFAETGLGLQGGWVVGGGAGANVTFKVESLPCVFAVDFGFPGGGISVGGTADWWIQNPTISDTWGWYYGVGAAASVTLGSNFGFGAYGRALVGTNIYLLDNFLELYIQAAWQPGIAIDTASDKPIIPVLFAFPINGGFRVWF